MLVNRVEIKELEGNCMSAPRGWRGSLDLVAVRQVLLVHAIGGLITLFAVLQLETMEDQPRGLRE